jgi:hypothetical protein
MACSLSAAKNRHGGWHQRALQYLLFIAAVRCHRVARTPARARITRIIKTGARVSRNARKGASASKRHGALDKRASRRRRAYDHISASAQQRAPAFIARHNMALAAAALLVASDAFFAPWHRAVRVIAAARRCMRINA